MALVTQIICSVCGERKITTMPDGVILDVCNDCTHAENVNKKYKYLDSLRELSVDERLDKIEEQLYSLKSLGGYW